MECVGDFMILCVLFLVEWHYSGKGLLYPYIMIFYGCLRFVLEFFRDTPKDWLYFSHGQWFSVVSVIAGACFLNRIMKELSPKKKRRK
jgi:prolipoprotein diacylglyceryltransferase